MARTSNRGNYPTHFPKKAVTEEEPDMTAEERERVAAGRGDAAAQWARENRIRAEPMRQSVRSNAYLLVVFTALYLVPLVFANSWHARGLGGSGCWACVRGGDCDLYQDSGQTPEDVRS